MMIIQLKSFCLAILSVMMLSHTVSAQSPTMQAAEWTFKVEPEANGKNVNEYVIIFSVTIPDDHHVYANGYDCPNGGPLPSEVKFTANDSYSLVGDLISVGAKDVYDDIFECKVKEFHHTGEFRQTVKYLESSGEISGVIEYQMCLPTGLCVLHTFEFNHSFKVGKTAKTK